MKNGKAEPIKNAILYEPVISRTKPNVNGPIALPNTPIESARPCISPKYLRPKLFAKTTEATFITNAADNACIKQTKINKY